VVLFHNLPLNCRTTPTACQATHRTDEAAEQGAHSVRS
jgi:predicted secreted protein